MTTVLAAADPYDSTSLLEGWLPQTIQIVAGVVLVAAIGWRSRRWRIVWLPLAAAAGAALAWFAHWKVTDEGVAGNPAPPSVWIWTALTGVAAMVMVLGFKGTRWWRRLLSVLAVPLCALSAAVMVNVWVGYFPTVAIAWNQATAGPLPDETDLDTVAEMLRKREVPEHGALVYVTIPSTASGFKHRDELVYLPPAYFASNPPPQLPTVMMIAGEFNTPADWVRTGHAVRTIDEFAAAHGGNAPVFVFVDTSGAFNNDTECVNGPRGNSADHLTKDVVPYMVSRFGVSPHAANWGIVGWSMGGTCAVDLTTMHPDLFSTFVDIAGDLAPYAGTKQQTIDRVFGGSEEAYDQFDPVKVIAKHGQYQGVSGWFAISAEPAERSKTPFSENPNNGIGGRDANPNPWDQEAAAHTLCNLGREHGIECAVVRRTGKHDWPFATNVFIDALPWLAGKIGTPGVPVIPLPPSAEPSSAPE
jgi:S-formylglutathione hydrolase FrmB